MNLIIFDGGYKILKKEKRNKDEKFATRQFSNPLISGLVNILTQNGNDMSPNSHELLHDDIKTIIDDILKGDTRTLITILTTNVMQLHLFNGEITANLVGDLGGPLDNYKKLTDMQIKVMQETRKSIMAINEINNPKRTTFIKEASQHNHLHQNLERKERNENELQKPTQFNESEPFREVKVTPKKGKIS